MLNKVLEQARNMEPAVKSMILVSILGLLLITLLGTCRMRTEPPVSDWDETRAGMLVAQAELAAHYISTAVDSGAMTNEINRTLQRITDETIVTEIWVTDSDGKLEYSSHPDRKRPDPTQGAGDPFEALLNGTRTAMVLNLQPRESDSKMYQYAGVAGVGQPRIVQLGISGKDLQTEK